MNIKKRIIPAKPRSKELYFERGGTSSRSSSSSSSSSVGGSSVEILTGEEGEKITNENVFSAEYINTHLNPLRDWFKLDEDGNLYTPKAFYSLNEISAFGKSEDESGSGGSGGLTEVSWGDILNKPTSFNPSSHTHTIANITNLQSTLNNKVDKVTGKSLILDSEITRLANVTNQTLSGLNGEPKISTGTTSQYWRGDKSWQTLNKSAVGLANVDNTADNAKNVLSATKLTTARTIWGQSFNGSANISGALTGVTNITASALIKSNKVEAISDIKTPKFDFGNGWTLEADGNEVALKQSGTKKARFTSGGIASMGELTAFGASSGSGNSKDYLLLDSNETQYILGNVEFAGGASLNGSIIKASLEFRLGSNWTITEQSGNLVFKKNGVIKHTING